MSKSRLISVLNIYFLPFSEGENSLKSYQVIILPSLIKSTWFLFSTFALGYLGSAELIHSHMLRGADVPPHCDNGAENSPYFG